MKHVHIYRNITHNYMHNELDRQGIIALDNKIDESSNINNWDRVRLDMVHEGLDGRLVRNWWENMLNCIGLGFKYLKWDTTTTTKVDQSSPYLLNKISCSYTDIWYFWRHIAWVRFVNF